VEQRIRIAIQKSGRLSEKSLELLSEAGLKVSNGRGTLKSQVRNFPVDLLFLRDDDIPQYVEDGVADLGIVGENVVVEKGKQVEIVKRLGFGSCRLSIAVPKEVEYASDDFLQGKKIATSYPNIVRKFLEGKGIQSEIHEISGSVEIAPSIGLAEAICDIVSTGSTLLSNGLKEVAHVMSSEAVLVGAPGLEEGKRPILEKLLFRLKAVEKAKNNKYILLNAPTANVERIRQVIPGMKSPTVMPLADPAWCSVHSVVPEDQFWEVIDQLKEHGAQGILVVPIEKMIL
jgi:ATP phosphoribosyltransferase